MSNKYHVFILSIILALILQACGNTRNINIQRPMNTSSNIQQPQAKRSHIHMGLNITWTELQRQINTNMPKVLMDDKEFNEDGLKVLLIKEGDLALKYQNKKVLSEIPLDVKVWYRYGALGVYDVREFRMKGTVYLSSVLSMRDFAIKTKTEIGKIVWKEDPKMMFFGKEMPVGFIVNKMINKESETIAAAIDKALEELMDFKPLIEEQLTALRDPILISEDYKIWLQTQAVRIESTPLSLNANKIELDVVLHALVKTTLGQKPMYTKPNDISYRNTTEVKKEIDVHLPVETSYSELSKLFTQKLKGMVLHEGKKPVVLDSIDLWHSEGKLVVAAQLSGRVKGWLYMRGVPKFNEEKQEIYLDELEYHINTKNALVKTLSWMLSGKILKLMQENARYCITKDLNELKTELTKTLNSYSPFEGTKLKFNISQLKFEELLMSNDGIVTRFQILANLSVLVG